MGYYLLRISNEDPQTSIGENLYRYSEVIDTIFEKSLIFELKSMK